MISSFYLILIIDFHDFPSSLLSLSNHPLHQYQYRYHSSILRFFRLDFSTPIILYLILLDILYIQYSWIIILVLMDISYIQYSWIIFRFSWSSINQSFLSLSLSLSSIIPSLPIITAVIIVVVIVILNRLIIYPFTLLFAHGLLILSIVFVYIPNSLAVVVVVVILDLSGIRSWGGIYYHEWYLYSAYQLFRVMD
jgi:hypothetical protein